MSDDLREKLGLRFDRIDEHMQAYQTHLSRIDDGYVPDRAVYKAIRAGKVAARRYGNVTLVERESAAAYRDRRRSRHAASSKKSASSRA